MTNEIQSLAIVDIRANQSLSLKKTGVATLSTAFKMTDSNATIKAAAEEVFGGTITATKSVTTSADGATGETIYNGTISFTFAGSLAQTDVPLIVLVSGEYHTYVVTSGDSDSDYGYAGSTGAALGFNAATFQTAIRATGGVKAAIIVKGSSVAPVVGSLLTTGGTVFSETNHGVNLQNFADGSTAAWAFGNLGAGYLGDVFALPSTKL